MADSMITVYCRCGRRQVAPLASCWKVCEGCGRLMWVAVLEGGSYVVGFEIGKAALSFPEIWAICLGLWWEDIEKELWEGFDREETAWDRWLVKVRENEAFWRKREQERAYREMRLEAAYWAAWMEETEAAGRLEKEYEKVWKKFEPPLSERQMRLLRLEQWKEENRKWQEWRDKCDFWTCEGCGYHKRACRCELSGERWLVGQMKRSLGINSRNGTERRGTWDLCELFSWNKGPGEGFRKCGPAFWDNSVRAWEEDR